MNRRREINRASTGASTCGVMMSEAKTDDAQEFTSIFAPDTQRGSTDRCTARTEDRLQDQIKSEVALEPSEDEILCTWAFSLRAGGLHTSQAPAWTARPGVLWGYRDTLSWRQCAVSAFQMHNEFGNVWTHLIGVPIFTSFFILDLTQPISVPLYQLVASIYNLACLFMLISSSVFHLVAPHSAVVYERALRVDITGVSGVTICSYLVGIRYGFFCNRDVAIAYLVVVGVLGLIAMGWSWVPSLLNNFKVTVCFFASFTAFSLVPLIHWIVIIGGPGSEQASVFLWKFVTMLVFYLVGFACFFSGLPEVKFPGRFDLVGSSHQIWHVMVLGGCLQFYVAMRAYADYWASHECVTH